jgi:hypothetical protein
VFWSLLFSPFRTRASLTTYRALFSCPLFNAVCSFESLKVDCLSCTWVVPKLLDDLSGLRSTHNDFSTTTPPSTTSRTEPHQGEEPPGSVFCPHFIGPHQSRRWWNFYCLQRHYAEPQSGLSWVFGWRTSFQSQQNIQQYVTKKEYSASCARQFSANEYSSFQATHKRLRKQGLRPRPSYYFVISHKRINIRNVSV